jgi:hypothetical protein
MCLWDLELLPVDRILHFEVLSQCKVIFVNASILMFAQNVKVSVLEFLLDLQVTSSLNFISGKSLPLHFWKVVVDVLETDDMKSSIRGTISSSSVSMMPKMLSLSKVTS